MRPDGIIAIIQFEDLLFTASTRWENNVILPAQYF